jgi:hypothetical protein
MICHSRQYWQAAFGYFLMLALIFNSFTLIAQTKTENLAKYFSLLRNPKNENGRKVLQDLETH